MKEEFDVDANDDRVRPGDLWGIGSAATAVAIFLGQAMLPGEWFAAAFGTYSNVFWLGVVIWAATSVVAVRKRGHWWVIATAIFAIYPLFCVGALLTACLLGNCV